MIVYLPINIKIKATSEEEAEKFLEDFLTMAIKEFGTEQKLLSWEYFKLFDNIDKESDCC